MTFEDKVIKVLKNVTIDNETGCWIYNGNIDTIIGYGRVQIDGKRYHTHRLSAYIYHDLNLSEWQKFVCHRCSDRRCCNPDHIYIGDNRLNQLDNINDKCPKGHNLVGRNIMWRERPNGALYRNCRICHSARSRAYIKTNKKVK